MATRVPAPVAQVKVAPHSGDWCAVAKILETNRINLEPSEIAALSDQNLKSIIKAEEYGQENCGGW